MTIAEICPCVNVGCPNHGQCDKCISRHARLGTLQAFGNGLEFKLESEATRFAHETKTEGTWPQVERRKFDRSRKVE